MLYNIHSIKQKRPEHTQSPRFWLLNETRFDFGFTLIVFYVMVLVFSCIVSKKLPKRYSECWAEYYPVLPEYKTFSQFHLEKNTYGRIQL